MQQKVANEHYAGLSTLVARKGQVVFAEQAGLRDVENNLPMDEDTIFRLYSMTKPIICTAFMTLYEQGKVDLLEPVANYIPAFSALKVLEKQSDGSEKLVDLQQPVLVHHLLTHTAGFSYDFYDSFSISAQYRQAGLNYKGAGVSLTEFIDKLCQIPLAFQPGGQFHYSVSIDVVARLIEIIAEQPLESFLQEVIFKPLGMNTMNFYLSDEQQKNLAAVYGNIDLCAENADWAKIMQAAEIDETRRIDVSSSAPVDDPQFTRGGLGLNATIEDYYRFAQMLLNGGELNGHRILSPKTLQLMHMNHLKPELLPPRFEQIVLNGYGFGYGSRVMVDVAASELAGSVGEYGWAGAALTHYWIDPKEDLLAIFMTQYLGDFSFTVRQFQALVYQALIN